jgi:ABC-type Fe3+/spermidine/putrescine transport system ATPase subunit
MPKLQLADVSKNFGRIVALNDINLEIDNGEYLCILGPTGSGKTTLLRLIAGLIKPDRGEILLDGRMINDVPPEERDVAYMSQQYALFPHMTVIDNVAFGPLSRGKSHFEASQAALEALKIVRLEERPDAFPNELSGGMQQRVALARGIASGAKLMLLDEPLGALDARLRVELRYRLKNIVKSLGLTAIHVTHDQKEAMVVADRILVLRTGRYEQQGTPFHVYQRPDNLFVANFVGDTNFLEGTTTKVDSTGTYVELRRGLKIRVRETSFLPGERVVLMIRQELISLKRTTDDYVNALPGVVQAVRFLGDCIRVEMKLENSDLIGAKIPLSDIEEFPEVGKKATISIRPADVSVFPLPPRGLAREIEVI